MWFKLARVAGRTRPFYRAVARAPPSRQRLHSGRGVVSRGHESRQLVSVLEPHESLLAAFWKERRPPSKRTTRKKTHTLSEGVESSFRKVRESDRETRTRTENSKRARLRGALIIPKRTAYAVHLLGPTEASRDIWDAEKGARRAPSEDEFCVVAYRETKRRSLSLSLSRALVF